MRDSLPTSRDFDEVALAIALHPRKFSEQPTRITQDTSIPILGHFLEQHFNPDYPRMVPSSPSGQKALRTPRAAAPQCPRLAPCRCASIHRPRLRFTASRRAFCPAARQYLPPSPTMHDQRIRHRTRTTPRTSSPDAADQCSKQGWRSYHHNRAAKPRRRR